MDRAKARTLTEEALEVLNKHFGERLRVTRGNSKYDDSSLTAPFTFMEPNEDGKIVT